MTGCETAFVNDLAGKKVVLLAPANNFVTLDSVHTFYWEKINGADRYRLRIVAPSFDSITRLIGDTIIFSDRFTIEMDKGSYQWRVRAINSASVSDESDTWNLKIQ